MFSSQSHPVICLETQMNFAQPLYLYCTWHSNLAYSDVLVLYLYLYLGYKPLGTGYMYLYFVEPSPHASRPRGTC